MVVLCGESTTLKNPWALNVEIIASFEKLLSINQ
jgi:hypothetical protein